VLAVFLSIALRAHGEGPALTEFALPSRSDPIRIASGSDGNIWFTETNRNRVGRITPNGEITEYVVIQYYEDHGASYFTQPYAITDAPGKGLFFTTLTGGVYRISYTGQIQGLSGVPWGYGGPLGIADGPDGNIWVTDIVGPLVARITPQGLKTEFVLPNGSWPRGITKGPDGNVWFADDGSTARVCKITPEGKISEYVLPQHPPGISCGVCPPSLDRITAGPDGNLWFTE
jgi:virginiamycin B lyase